MKEFIKAMLSSNDNVSSKRVLGMLLILNYCATFVTTYWVELSATQVAMANNMLMTGGALLGLGIIDKFITK